MSGPSEQTAQDILAAIRRHHARAAIVPEITVVDVDAIERRHDDPSAPGPVERRIDALMFQSLERTAIEIKVSKADYRRDTWQKREPWRRICHRFVYAVPAALLDGETLPYGCGVWEIDPTGRLAVVRKAVINRHPEPLPQRLVQNLAYRACGRSSIEAIS